MISKEITEVYGGQIKVKSKWGVGSKFTYFFCLEPDEVNDHFFQELRQQEQPDSGPIRDSLSFITDEEED